MGWENKKGSETKPWIAVIQGSIPFPGWIQIARDSMENVHSGCRGEAEPGAGCGAVHPGLWGDLRDTPGAAASHSRGVQGTSSWVWPDKSRWIGWDRQMEMDFKPGESPDSASVEGLELRA